MICECVTNGELADQVIPTAVHRDRETESASDHPTAREVVPDAEGRDEERLTRARHNDRPAPRGRRHLHMDRHRQGTPARHHLLPVSVLV
jgi:hypothetical protein